MESTNSKPFISIIMNCYNSAKYLTEALDSVLSQSYSDFELIFWDNQSTDKSAEIVKSYQDQRFRYFYSPVHTNLGEARKMATREARGEWIGFLDCDDLWLPDKLEKQVTIIKSDRSAQLGLVYGRNLIFGSNYGNGVELGPYKGQPLPEGDIFETLLLKENFIPFLSALIKKEAYFACGEFPGRFKHAPDYYMFSSIAKSHLVRAVNDIICKYRIHDSNLSLSQKAVGYLETIHVINLFRKDLEKRVPEKVIEKRLSTLHTFAGLMYIFYEKCFLKGFLYIKQNGSFWIMLSVLYQQLKNKVRMLSGLDQLTSTF